MVDKLQEKGLPKELTEKIAEDAKLNQLQLGPNLFLKLESAEQVKNDLYASKTTGPDARYTIGQRSIVPTINTVKKINSGDFKISTEELKNFLICVAANHKQEVDSDHELIDDGKGLYILNENRNVRISAKRGVSLAPDAPRWELTYSSGGSFQTHGGLESVDLKMAFNKWLENYFKKG